MACLPRYVCRSTPAPAIASALWITLTLALFSLRAEGAENPFRLGDADAVPDWLTVSGSYRLRYEWLEHPFNAGAIGSDELLVSRLMLAAEARASDSIRFGVELVDARAWGAENDTPLGTDDVNALEPLQIYAGWRGTGVFEPEDSLDVRLGRFTLGMGSNRFVARHVYRNTLQAHTGASIDWKRSSGLRVQAFATRPVTRLPASRPGLDDNDVRFDEDSDTDFFGVHVDGWSFVGADASVFLFDIDDSASGTGPARLRNYLTAGFRLVDDGDAWTWEIETAWQHGSVRVLSPAAATQELDHRALMVHADIGRRFEGRWRPHLEFRVDYATGDDRPDDNDSERYDTLFGPLRFDFGPTGIYNAVRRNNTVTAGLYLNLSPRNDMRWMTGFRSAWLDSRRDNFGGSGLRDPSGQSGRFAGHQVETRFRWELIPGNLRWETGGAWLGKGEFLENAPGALDPSDTIYLYSNFLLTF